MEVQSQQVLLIESQLERLKATTDYNAYSGLLVEVLPDERISIFDDHSRAILTDPAATIAALEKLDPIDWDDNDNTETAFEPVWDAINISGAIKA